MMAKRFFQIMILAAAVSFAWPVSQVEAFPAPANGTAGKCSDCHVLSKEEAAKLLKTDMFKAQIKDIRMSPVKGLWEIEIAQGDKVFLVYIDFAKKYLVEGRYTPVDQLGESKPLKKVDVRKIPLDNAVVMGNPKAEKKIIVFDDPECPYCAKLHEEIKKIVAKRSDLAFYIKMYPLAMHPGAYEKSIKMYPLAMHPGAYEKSKAIVCQKSPKLLDDAFAGKKLPKAECETQEIDNNIKLAEDLGITGTPAMILPDGRLVPGYVSGDVLLGIIDNTQS
ncbi:MAG: DsbC family protein [Deltaproteobacteria bacterium]|nr:DsbC family protein [Deltaproteobacteria bacterium]